MFSLILCARIPAKYRALADLALKDAAKRSANSKTVERMEPGFYNFDGISFHLTRPLINPDVAEVSGFAKKDNIIALVQSRSALDSNFMSRKPVFAIPSEQKIYDLGEAIASDGTVELFDVSTLNPLTVFSDLGMQTQPKYGYDCSFNESIFTGAKCKAWFSYNWPDAPPGVDPLTLRPNYQDATKNGSISYGVGAYGQAIGQVALKFQGLFDVTADFSIDINAVGGVGVRVKEKVLDYNLKIYEFRYPIYAVDIEVLGIRMGLGVEAYIGFLLNHISIELPELDYYRDLVFNFHKSGKLSTKSGYHGDPFTYDIHSDTYSNLDNNSLIDYLEHIKIGVQPTVDMGIAAIAYVGDLLKTDLKIGSDFHLDLQFGMNTTLCTMPYLYGNAAFGIDFYIRSIGIQILSFNLVPSFDFTWPIYQSHKSPDFCLFSSKNSKEGLIAMTSEVRIPSVVIRPTYSYPETAAPNNNPFTVRLDAYPESDVQTPYRSLQLESMKFAQGSQGESNKFNLNRALVLTNPKDTTTMKYTASWNQRFTLPEFQVNEEFNKSICGHQSNDGVCIQTEVFSSQTVEEFKEFDANHTFISFKPSTAVNGDIFGVITHGQGESYTAPLSKFNVYDDSAFANQKDINKGEYRVNRFLNVSIDGMKHSDNKDDVQIDFYKCMDSCDPIGSLYVLNVPKNQYVKAKTVKAAEYSIPFDLSGDKFTLKAVMNGKTFELSRDELNFEGSFMRMKSIESDTFQIGLLFENTIPTLLFQTEYAKGKDNYKGIVAKVFQPSKLFVKEDLPVHIKMATNETYGILRYFFAHGNDEIAKNTTFTAIIKGKGFVPLCNYMPLDDDHIAITLVWDETLFSTKEQTQYFADSLSINIPFRRQTLKAAEFDITLSSVFISGDKPICSVTGLVTAKGKTGMFTGCIDTLTQDNHLRWTPLFSHLSSGFFQHFRLEAPKWALEAYQIKDVDNFEYFEFRTRYGDLELPENASTLFVEGKRCGEFAAVNKPIYITCPKCSSIRAETSKTKTQLTKEEDKYVYRPTTADDVLFVAVCSNASQPFCEFEEDLSNDGLCLLEYLSDDGVRDIAYNSDSIKLLDSVRRQIVYGRNNTKLMKTWAGRIAKVATNIQPDKFQLIVTANKNKTSELSAKLGDLSIPLSAGSFRYDPIEFLNRAMITQPKKGFTNGDVMFTASGSVVVRNELLGDILNAENIHELSDIPHSYVYSSEVVCGEHSVRKGNKCVRKLTPGEWISENVGLFCGIIGAVIAVCLLIVAGVIIIKKSRGRREMEKNLLTQELASGLKEDY